MALLLALTLLGACLAGLALWRWLSSDVAAFVPQAQPTESLKTMAVANLRRYVRTRTLVDRHGQRVRLRILFMGPAGAGKSSFLNLLLNSLVDTAVQPIVRLLWNSHQARGVQGNRFNQQVPHTADGLDIIDCVGAPGGEYRATAAHIYATVVDPSRQPSVPNRHANAARLTRSPTSQAAHAAVLVLAADMLAEVTEFWSKVIACLHNEYNFDALLVYVTATDRFLAKFGREFNDADARKAAEDLGMSSDKLFFGSSYVETDTERQDERERPALRMLAQAFAVVEATADIVPPTRSERLAGGVMSYGAALMNKPRDTQIAICAVTALIALVCATVLSPKQSIMAGYSYPGK